MVCPRCSTNVSADALYCSYCSLPKPKAGFAKESATSPIDRPAAHSASRKTHKPHKQSTRPSNREQGPKRKIRVTVLGVAGLVAVLSVGAFIFIAPLVFSQGVEPKLALSALDKLQHTPSNDPDLTIDARLSAELEKSRRVGNLVGYQGWTVHPIKGTKTRVLLVFSFREVGNTEQRAEWLADLNANTFTPQTALAVAIHGKQ